MLEYIISLMRIKVTLTGGAKRDSGYIYGPGMPRSYFAGVKLSFNFVYIIAGEERCPPSPGNLRHRINNLL